MFGLEKRLDERVAQAGEKFNAILAYLLGEGQSDDAYRVEVRLFRELLALGLLLLVAWFLKKLGGDVGKTIVTEDDEVLRRERLTSRPILTVFGELRVPRWYYHKDGSSGVFPLDEEANLPEAIPSYYVQELVERRGARMAYDEALADVAELFGFRLRKECVLDLVAESAVDADPFYESLGTPPPETEAEILAVAVDGKGVPMIKGEPAEHKVRLGRGEKRSRKREAVVAAVYTIAPYPRTAEEIVAEVQDKQTPPKRPKPQNKRLRATLDGKEDAFAWAVREVERRDPHRRKVRVCLLDGAKALWRLALSTLTGFIYILDLFHVNEYLWKAAHVFHAEKSPEAEAFVRRYLLMLLRGKVGYVIGALRQMLTKHGARLTKEQRKTLGTVIGYYEANRRWMRYDEYIAAGLPIGSGVVEGACHHLVKDRMEGSGMRWSLGGAAAVLKLRAIHLNGDWDAFWQFHMKQEARRRFGHRRWAPVACCEARKAS